MTTHLYTCFHLNLAFSSIEEEERPLVIERCYWPLLNLAKRGHPIGLEASAYTLDAIASIDPKWISDLRALLDVGAVEFIGSGLVQMIAPLVPADVTRANLALGMRRYQDLLGVKPTLALINEQAMSGSLIPLYREAGYDAIMLDWTDARHHHADWPDDMASVVHLSGPDEDKIGTLWSDAILFQKLQRFVHGEVSFPEFFDYLDRRLANRPVALPLYTSDAEIFDYRPGRFMHEPTLVKADKSEWTRLESLLSQIREHDDVDLVLPSEARAMMIKSSEGFCGKIGTAVTPVSVKKQRKYNLSRWGVSGRSDLRLNTACWRLFERDFAHRTDAISAEGADREEWSNLCQLWASDYRTHITQKRLDALLQRFPTHAAPQPKPIPAKASVLRASEDGRFTILEGEGCYLVLNRYRGLAVQAFGFGAAPDSHSEMDISSLVGTMPHGAYDDLAFAADFYTGHLVIEPHDSSKITDLERCTADITCEEDKGVLSARTKIKTPLGDILKEVTFYPANFTVRIAYRLPEPWPSHGSVRFAYMHLNPRAFDRDSLFYRTHNGGDGPETYYLKTALEAGGFDHGAPVSRLVTSTTAQGMTGDWIEMGDAAQKIRLTMHRSDVAGLPLVKAVPASENGNPSWFVRTSVSLQESDETRRPTVITLPAPSIRYDLSLHRTNDHQVS